MQFFFKKSLNLCIAWRAGNSTSNPSISEIFLKSPNFLWNVVWLNFLNFYQETCKFGFWVQTGNLSSNLSISGIFLIFPNLMWNVLEFSFTEKRLNLAICLTAGNLISNPSISASFLKFPYFLWNVLELICCNFLPKNA